MNPIAATDRRQDLENLVPEDPERVRRLNGLRDEILRVLEADATMERYGAAADESEDALCCPVEYDREALAHIPKAILDIDYGCGDPTVFARPGQTVLDLGSGSGKHCFMISKAVGPDGRVIGVDKTPEMLAKSREAIPEVMKNLGYPAPNVEFRYGHIENLALNKDRLLELLAERPIKGYEDLDAIDSDLASVPLIENDSVDLVVSNCVLNLVEDGLKQRLIDEIFRVLRRGGEIAISDIVADRAIPKELKDDDDLWSGCLSGAWQRDEFVQAFARAGFYGMHEVKAYFWKRVEDINFYSVTIRAFKGKQGPCYETYRAALYKGPFAHVADDDQHDFARGVWTPVCDKTAEILSREPYASSFIVTPALEDAAKKLPFDCSGGAGERRWSGEQHQRLNALVDEGACCDDESGCC